MVDLYLFNSIQMARIHKVTAAADFAILDRVFQPVENPLALQDMNGPLMIKLAQIMTRRMLNGATTEINKIIPFIPGYCEAHFIHAINQRRTEKSRAHNMSWARTL